LLIKLIFNIIYQIIINIIYQIILNTANIRSELGVGAQ